jgi:predicted methyltransferase
MLEAMNGKTENMSELTDIEYDVLNAVYFVEPFENIVNECNAPAPIVADVIKQLIHKKYIAAMQWDEEKNEYIRSYIYDTDNMKSFFYLATKDGLMAHNSR